MSELKRIMVEGRCDAESYSGRGMYGKQCVSVAAESVTEALQKGLADIEEDTAYDDERTAAEALELVAEMLNYSSETLGMGVVVYWPWLEWD